MTNEEFERRVKLLTPDEAKQLARDVDRMLRWWLWKQKHPTLANIIEGICAAALVFAAPSRTL